MKFSFRRINAFTLIELIAVIAILGVLSATVVPKLVNLQTQSRIASLNALAGALQSAANNLRMLCAVNSSCDLNNGQQHIYLNNNWYWLNYGWVDAGDDIGVDEIDAALNTAGYSISLPNIYSTLFSFAGAPTPANCSVLYYQATAANRNPVITTTISGC